MKNKNKTTALKIYHGDLIPLCPIHMGKDCEWEYFTSTPVGKKLVGVRFKCGAYCANNE